MRQSFDKLPRNTTVLTLKISDKNKEFINKFLAHIKNHVVDDRWRKYRHSLYRFAELLQKDFDKLTKEDCHRAAGIIATSKTLTSTTKEDLISDVRRAMKTLFGNDEEYPEFIKSFKLPRHAKNKGMLRLPKKVLTEKQTYELIKACNNSRDQFFIGLLGLDGGLRPLEAYRLLWSCLKKDKHSYYLEFDTSKDSGDKQTRVVRIIKSEPYLTKWMSDYPKEKDDNDLIFINTTNHKPMNDGTAHALFRRLRKKLGIKERLYPYLLRHSLITRMSKDPRVPISVLKKFVGHSKNSNIIGEYQHFGDDDLKAMQLEYNNMIVKKKDEVSERKPVTCPRCKKSNEYDNEICIYCSMALSQKRVVDIHDALEKNNKMMFDLFTKMIKGAFKLMKKRMNPGLRRYLEAKRQARLQQLRTPVRRVMIRRPIIRRPIIQRDALLDPANALSTLEDSSHQIMSRAVRENTFYD